jgi:NifB/MoaA-like Fe-S oxidoreductase
MKKVIRLSENDLIKVIKKIVKEVYDEVDDLEFGEDDLGDDSFYEHTLTLDYIVSKFNKNTTEKELEFILNQIEYELGSVVQDEELNYEQINELIIYGNELADTIIEKFKDNQK